jgi:hypothetical protein
MANSTTNHGEGNPEAAEEFNKAEREFVESARGREKIRRGAEVRPGEEADLANAEEQGKSRARNDDSNTTQMREQPPRK